MAKIRDIKNEVNYLSYEVISDCNTFMALHPDKREQALKLVEEAVSLRNQMIQKINHPKEVNAQYFRAVKKELLEGADVLFEKLRKMIK
jgi:tRNA uridine 5-carbamoylmethylation protein Kti12